GNRAVAAASPGRSRRRGAGSAPARRGRHGGSQGDAGRRGGEFEKETRRGCRGPPRPHRRQEPETWRGVSRFALRLALALGLAAAAFAQEHAPAGEKAGEHKEAAEKDLTGYKWANFAILAAALGFLLVKQAGPYFSARSLEIRKGIDE